MRISDWSSDVCSSDLLSCLCRNAHGAYQGRTRYYCLGRWRPSPKSAWRSARAPGDLCRAVRCRRHLSHHARRHHVVVDARDHTGGAARPRRLFRSPAAALGRSQAPARRTEEHTSELQSLMRISYAVFFLKKKITIYKLSPDSIITHT